MSSNENIDSQLILLQIIGISNYLPPIFTGLGLTGSMPLVMYGECHDIRKKG